MEHFIYFLLATFSITLIFTKSHLFKPFRERFWCYTYQDDVYEERTLKGKIYTFLNCPLCVGVWVGFFVRTGLIFYLDVQGEWIFLVGDVFTHGCIGGMFSMLAYLLFELLGFSKH